MHTLWQQTRRVFCLLRRGRSRFLLGIILILSSLNRAQVNTGSISGVITDQSGAVILGTDAKVTNSGTKVTYDVTSNQSGVYLVTGFKLERYRIKVAKEGFKGIDLTHLILNVQDSVNRNFTLQAVSRSGFCGPLRERGPVC